ncbi:MAG: outer membrane protein assembly factor BamA [Nitrospinae bacterium]|nr:outer membrane protein assembly factor BamA [Nitrospinota bacterium]
MSHWSGVGRLRRVQLSRQKTIIVFLTAVIFFLSQGKSGAIDSASGMIDLTRPIVHISIKGNERVHESTIRYYISLKEGDVYSPSKIRNDIKRIYDLGYFDDIKVDLEEEASGLTVAYLIKEKPFIKNVIIKGIKEIEDFEIKKKLSIKKGIHFKSHFVQKDIDSIKKLYQEKGFYFASVDVSTKNVENNQVDIEFKINEGKKVYVTDIVFVGNKYFDERAIKKQVDTQEKGAFSWFTSSGTYKKEILKTDILKLESLYHDNGFIKVKVEDPRVEIDKELRRIYITIFLNEGEQYRVGSVHIEGDEVYSEKELSGVFNLKENDIFNRSQLSRDVFTIADMYSQKGYAFADVMPNIKTDENLKKVDIDIKIDKGKKVYIGKINVFGNEKTRDNVIRREFRLQEGSLFDSSKIRRSRERINNLGFFDEVNFEQKSRREEDMIDLDVKVTERSTGSLSAGAGYSSVENAILFAQISQSNLFGKGYKLAFNAQLSSIRKDYEIDFTEPRLFDRELLAGLSLFNTERNYFSYLSKNNGGSVRLGKSLGEYTWGNISYKYELVNIYISNRDVASSFLLSQEGDRTTSSITPSVTRDTRDDFFNPQKGSRQYLNGDYAGGPLGGIINYYKMTGEESWYYPLWWNLVFMIHGKIGYADGHGGKDLPIFERFFLGGPESLRGFNFNDVGPRDAAGQSIGGRSLLLLNTEFLYPFTRYVRGVVFYDRGNVYGKEGDLSKTTSNDFDIGSMRHAWGFGVRFYSPIGPISFAWGFKLDQKKGESPSEFHFTIGRAF